MTERKGAEKPKPLGPAPKNDAPIAELRDYLARAYGLRDDYCVERVVRYGGRAGSSLDVFIRPPGGAELRVHYEEERHCRHADTLRGQAAADTDGLTRGDLITTKAAPAIYEALCSLADTYERMDDRAQTWEWSNNSP